MRQITELLEEEINHLTGIANSKEQLEAGAMAKLGKCRGMSCSVSKWYDNYITACTLQNHSSRHGQRIAQWMR